MRLVLAALVALCAPPQHGTEPESSLHELRAVLRDPRVPTTRREALLRAFLERPTDSRLAPDLRLALGVQLARLELANRKPRAAITRFERIASTCAARDVDLLAACRLGIAQANALLGLRREAARLYAGVTRDFPGTRYARSARDALARAEPTPLGRSVLPDLETSELPALCVFVSATGPKPPATLAAILASERVAERCELVLVVCGREPGWRARYEASAFARTGNARLVRRQASLADPLLARLGVRTLPTWLLVSPGGRCVDRNPSLLGLTRLVGAASTR